MRVFPVIETERLILRVPEIGDFEAYAELFGDPEAARHIGGAVPRAAAWRRFLQMPGAWHLQGFAMFSVIDRNTGEWLGQAGPWQPEGWNGTEVGWSFRRACWGRGYATEAGRAAIDWAFETLGWDEVIHNIDAGNDASIRLAERLGSRYRGEGRLPEPFAAEPVGVWAQTRAEWQSAKAR